MLFPTCRRTVIGSCVLLCSCLCGQAAFPAEPDADSTESVVVTATRSARSLEDVPESVSVITARSITDTPAQALDDVLRLSPSVDLPNATSYQLHPTANNI